MPNTGKHTDWTIQRRLRHLMELRGVGQNALARRVGLTSGAMSLLMSGDTKQPSPATLLRLAEALESHPEWILTGRGPMLISGDEPPAEIREAVTILEQLDAETLDGVLKLLRSLRRP